MTLRRRPFACRDAAWRSAGLGRHRPLGVDTGRSTLPQMLRVQRAGSSREAVGRAGCSMKRAFDTKVGKQTDAFAALHMRHPAQTDVRGSCGLMQEYNIPDFGCRVPALAGRNQKRSQLATDVNPRWRLKRRRALSDGLATDCLLDNCGELATRRALLRQEGRLERLGDRTLSSGLVSLRNHFFKRGLMPMHA